MSNDSSNWVPQLKRPTHWAGLIADPALMDPSNVLVRIQHNASYGLLFRANCFYLALWGEATGSGDEGSICVTRTRGGLLRSHFIVIVAIHPNRSFQ